MTQRYFAILFIILAGGLLLGLNYFIGEQLVSYWSARLLIIWILIGFYLGQYSSTFPKE
jgi:hypothetical protein